MNEKEKRILEMQSESTRRCLERGPELDFEWLSRSFPQNAQCRDDNGNIFINARRISFDEAAIYQAMREKRGERLAEVRKEEEPSSKANKENAVEAFMNKKGIETWFDFLRPQRIRAKFFDLISDLKTERAMANIDKALEKLSK